MGSIYAYKGEAGRRYRVVYRKPDNSQSSKRGFKTKKDAELFLATLDIAIAQGDFIDQSAARITVGALGPQWLATQSHLKPSSFRVEESSWRTHVEPAWGNRRIGTIRHSEVQSWVAQMEKERSATTTKRALGVLSKILSTAVLDRRMSSNPATDVKTTAKKGIRRAYLDHAQVRTLVANCPNHGTLVLLLAYTGLRWGEATGLRVRNVNMLRQRVNVEDNAVMVGSQIQIGTPKGHSARSVPFPSILIAALEQQCAGRSPDDLLFGDGTNHVRLSHSKSGWFAAAVRRSRVLDPSIPHLTVHGLRHTAASLAVSSGANVKVIQRMLGHKSAAMTLDQYSDLFDDDLDSITASMDRAIDASFVAKSLPRAVAVN